MRNKEKRRASNRAYYKRNREELTGKARGKYNPDKRKGRTDHVARNIKYFESWFKIIKDSGKDKCSVCGYNKCFAAIDFHHIDSSEKKIGMAYLLGRKPTPERISELEKCISLCANCHRELHSSRNDNNGRKAAMRPVRPCEIVLVNNDQP